MKKAEGGAGLTMEPKKAGGAAKGRGEKPKGGAKGRQASAEEPEKTKEAKEAKETKKQPKEEAKEEKVEPRRGRALRRRSPVRRSRSADAFDLLDDLAVPAPEDIVEPRRRRSASETLAHVGRKSLEGVKAGLKGLGRMLSPSRDGYKVPKAEAKAEEEVELGKEPIPPMAKERLASPLNGATAACRVSWTEEAKTAAKAVLTKELEAVLLVNASGVWVVNGPAQGRERTVSKAGEEKITKFRVAKTFKMGEKEAAVELLGLSIRDLPDQALILANVRHLDGHYRLKLFKMFKDQKIWDAVARTLLNVGREVGEELKGYEVMVVEYPSVQLTAESLALLD